MRRVLLALVTLAVSSSEAAAAPWALGKGKVFAQAAYRYLGSSTLHAPDGTAFDIPRYRHHDLDLFVAAGPTESLTAFLNLPIVRSSDLEDFGSESGIGDLEGGLQARILSRGPWVAALRGSIQAPTGDETRADGLLPTGTGVWEFEAVAGLGRNLANGRGWTFVELGHQVRGGQLRDSLLYAVQMGWHLNTRVALTAGLSGVQPYDTSARGVPIGSPTGLSDRVTYTTYGPGVQVRLGGPWTAHFEVTDTFHARNLATGLTFRSGLSWSR